MAISPGVLSARRHVLGTNVRVQGFCRGTSSTQGMAKARATSDEKNNLSDPKPVE